MADPKIEQKARAMHDAVAPKYGLPSWDKAAADVRATWLRVAAEMHEIAKGISYDD